MEDVLNLFEGQEPSKWRWTDRERRMILKHIENYPQSQEAVLEAYQISEEEHKQWRRRLR